jgi:hypothetical protein
MGAVPSYVLMRVGAQLIQDKEHTADATWLDIGFGVADGGVLLLVIALVVTGIGARRAKRGLPAPARGLTVAAALGGVLIAAYVVAIFAMTAKPA